jgi:hypothetical protein
MSAVDSTESTARDTVREVGGSVDAEAPWLGLASFTEETQAYFFGRESEVAELTRRVQRKLLTVLFGKSGLGKTSILRAGLVPRLRAQGYFPVYLRIDYGHDSPEPAEQIKQAINRAARGTDGETGGQWTQTDVAAPGESIWEFLHHRDDVLKGASGARLIPLLIFDQFEELFTLAQSDEFGRARAAKFIEELSDLVENRPPKALEAKLESDETIAERFDFSRSDYRVVIALREDYLAPLESLKKVMPSLSQNRLRLAPMTGNQALEAVLQPGSRLRPGRPLVSEEVAEAIVRFVAGGSELANAEVEPSLLSLICRELNEQRIAQARSEISQDLLAGSHDTILSTFYERSLADQPEPMRRIIEDDLLTESGYRENLAEESLLRRFQMAGAAPDALSKLVNRRLLRIEERLDVRRVELTHDVLTGVVRASRDARQEREAREATERALAEQRAREEAAHRALRRTRAVAAGCTLLAAVAFAAAIFALVSFKRARHAELIAQQTRAVSEQARREAEGLLGFLTDNFVRELETFGRYQTIAELSQREIDYFQHLPPQLKDSETIRSGALALINHANALVYIGDVSAADKNVTQAVALLGPLERTDKSVATAIALAQAYTVTSSVRVVQENVEAGIAADRRALEVLRPTVERRDSTAEARRAYAATLADATWSELFGSGDNTQGLENAIRDGREAMRLISQLEVHRMGDVTLDADYAFACIGLVPALDYFGHYGEAVRAGEDALARANRVLAQRPQYGRALIAKQFCESALMGVASDELDPVEAVRFGLQSIETSRALIQVEPQNDDYLNNLGVAEGSLSGVVGDAGRLRDQVAYLRDSMDAFAKSGEGGKRPFSFLFTFRTMAAAAASQAQLGEFSGAAATLATGNAYVTPKVLRTLGPTTGGNIKAAANDWSAYAAAVSAYERDDFAGSRRIARTALATFSAHRYFQQPLALFALLSIEAYADYALGQFSETEQAARGALQALRPLVGTDVGDRRNMAAMSTWLSIALAREGKREEAAQTVGPVVAMYRGLMKQNHGDQWLPLELAEALYAQSLTDAAHRPALLREAARLVDHLIPAIAKLHDTRQWRARIEAAQRLP